MLLFSGIVFLASLLGIVLLFAVKYWEMTGDRELIPTGLRMKADDRALQTKQWLAIGRNELSRIPPLSVLVIRFLIHEAALALAAFARVAEAQAHRLAELVSHRRTFEKREPRSQFLKQVSEHKSITTTEVLEIRKEETVVLEKPKRKRQNTKNRHSSSDTSSAQE